jgi:hypothetical protein
MLVEKSSSGEVGEALAFSWVRSEFQATIREIMHENTQGGELMRRVGT